MTRPRTLAHLMVTAALAYLVARQGRRLVDQTHQLDHQGEAAIRQTMALGDTEKALHEALADNDGLRAENTVIRRENADLRDQLDRQLRIAVGGGAS